jgi:hypothetical protein
MVAPIQIGAGITFGAGISVGTGSAPSGDGAITYLEMSPPIVPGQQLEDSTATVNAPTGFTINLTPPENPGNTGVAVTALTANNIAYYTNLGNGYFTATYGPGSTYGTSQVQIVDLTGSAFTFFIDPGLTYPATFNFPITIA